MSVGTNYEMQMPIQDENYHTTFAASHPIPWWPLVNTSGSE
jgi:hypothetical protein